MAKALTAIAIANLKPRPQRYEVSDAGCHGLRVVVFPSRRKSFVVRFRFKGGQRKLTLGPCLLGAGAGEQGEPTDAPELNTPLSLAAARELATKALRQARSGADPCAAKQKARQEELAAESDTLGAIAAEYLRREGPKLRSLKQRESDLALLCASGGLGRLRVAEIGRGKYTHVLDHIADHNGPVRADRVLSALRTLLTWYAKRDDDFVSPLVRGMRQTSIAERARSRVLSDDELRAVWLAAEQDKGPFGPFVRFVLLTSTRRGEAAALQRGELSAGGTVWTIPAARYKSKRDTLIPLSAAAQDIIVAQPELGPFVFGADGSRPLGGFDDRKADFDKVAGISNYVLHDVRRTARTLLSRAGVAPDIAERCLGHAMVGVRATYDRFEFIDEKRDAFERLASLVETIVRPPPDVVVPITRAKAARR
jgi:integrase